MSSFGCLSLPLARFASRWHCLSSPLTLCLSVFLFPVSGPLPRSAPFRMLARSAASSGPFPLKFLLQFLHITLSPLDRIVRWLSKSLIRSVEHSTAPRSPLLNVAFTVRHRPVSSTILRDALLDTCDSRLMSQQRNFVCLPCADFAPSSPGSSGCAAAPKKRSPDAVMDVGVASIWCSRMR